MTSRDLHLLNTKIEILYQVQKGTTLTGVAQILHISRQYCSHLYTQARTDPKIQAAAAQRQQYLQQQHEMWWQATG